MENTEYIIPVLLLIAAIVFCVWFFVFKTKHLKLPNVYLVTGSVKTGKSVLSVCLAVKTYKRNLMRAHVRRFFQSCFKKPLDELPMLYSNMKLRNVRYNLLSLDILERKVRIPHKSVVLIDEVSLVADSMLFKNDLLNQRLSLFVKLFGHYTHGGTLIINTQALKDCHYAFKRSLQSYLWIQSRKPCFGFTLFSVREMTYSDEDNVMNVFTKDNEVDNRPLFMLNNYYKYYDCYCWSVFTDGLQLKVDYDSPILKKEDSLKTGVLVSFQDYQDLKSFKEVKEDEVR